MALIWVLLAFGSQDASVPSVPIAARRLRAVPPIEVNTPPAYTVDPDTANAYKGPLAFGSHVVSSVPLVPIAAT